MEIWTGQVFWSKNFFVNLPYSGAQPRFFGQDFCHCSNKSYQKKYVHSLSSETAAYLGVLCHFSGSHITGKEDPEYTLIVFIVS
jgi:hypothetical protein